MVCSRMPKRSLRPCSAACLDPPELVANRARRFAPGQVDVGVPGGDRAGRR